MNKIRYNTMFGILWAAAACAPPSSNEDDVADITRTTHEWVAAFEAGDATRAATVGDTTRYVLVWERQADGSWKVAYDIWNSALPVAGGR